MGIIAGLSRLALTPVTVLGALLSGSVQGAQNQIAVAQGILSSQETLGNSATLGVPLYTVGISGQQISDLANTNLVSPDIVKQSSGFEKLQLTSSGIVPKPGYDWSGPIPSVSEYNAWLNPTSDVTQAVPAALNTSSSLESNMPTVDWGALAGDLSSLASGLQSSGVLSAVSGTTSTASGGVNKKLAEGRKWAVYQRPNGTVFARLKGRHRRGRHYRHHKKDDIVEKIMPLIMLKMATS